MKRMYLFCPYLFTYIQTGKTALMVAAYQGHSGAVATLLQHQADKDLQLKVIVGKKVCMCVRVSAWISVH